MDIQSDKAQKILKENSDLIQLVVRSVQQLQYVPVLETNLTQAAANGWALLVDAIRKVTAGERDIEVFQNLDEEDRTIIMAILYHLDNAGSSTGVEPSDSCLANYQQTSNQLLNEHRYFELIDACNEALDNYPQDTELNYKLAWGLERIHKLSEAREVLNKLLSTNPGHVHARLTLAKIEKRSGEFEAARDRLESLKNIQTVPQHKCEILTELGDVYDRMGEYARAFECYSDSNQALLKTVDQTKIKPNAIFDWIGKYRQTFTSRYMAGWDQQEPEDELPDPVFLVGFPRSGTTLTEQIITASGDVTPTNEQPLIHELISASPQILGRNLPYPAGLDTLSAADITKLRRHYWQLADKMVESGISEGGGKLLDKLPLNLMELGFIHRIFPKAPVVILLRDPRDCCLSCYKNYFVLNDAMIHFLDLGQTTKLYSAVMDYWLHLRSFIKQPVMQIRYEDIVGDFSNTTRSLIEFLGLEWSDSVLSFHEQAGKRNVRTPSYSEISKPVSDRAIGRWGNYSDFVGDSQQSLSPFIAEFGYDKN